VLERIKSVEGERIGKGTERRMRLKVHRAEVRGATKGEKEEWGSNAPRSEPQKRNLGKLHEQRRKTKDHYQLKITCAMREEKKKKVGGKGEIDPGRRNEGEKGLLGGGRL